MNEAISTLAGHITTFAVLLGCAAGLAAAVAWLWPVPSERHDLQRPAALRRWRWLRFQLALVIGLAVVWLLYSRVVLK